MPRDRQIVIAVVAAIGIGNIELNFKYRCIERHNVRSPAIHSAVQRKTKS
jgi:hypothetical protein